MSTTYTKIIDEEAEQEIVIQWARLRIGSWPELQLLHHIPNGGSRSKREGAKLKRMGVLAGVSDLHLPVARAGYNSLYIEMKCGDGRLSASQKSFLKLAAYFGNYCVTCYTAEDAIEVLKNYVKGNVIVENLSILKNGTKTGTVS